MNNLIKYYYNLSCDELRENEDFSLFKCNDGIYIFKKYNMDIKLTTYLADFLYQNNIKTHKLVFNKDNELITKYNNQDYILLKVEDNFIVDDIIIDIPINKVDDVDIPSLWEKKVDYYMMNMHDLGLNKKVLIDTFNYYVGLAENAISLYRDALSMDGEVYYVVAHKRMHYPNYSINYLDPTSMLIDTRIRDMAEYIKNRIIYDDIKISDVNNLIFKYHFSIKEMNLLYARLFYPTYYFDVFEDNIISEKESKDLVLFYEKRTSYEKFLRDFYQKYHSQYNIFYVEWLFKEEH